MPDIALYLLALIERLIQTDTPAISLTIREDPVQDSFKIILENHSSGVYQKNKKEWLTISTRLSRVEGNIYEDLAAVLASVACTVPYLDLRLECYCGEHHFTLQIKELANEIPLKGNWGLSLARQVQNKIRIGWAVLHSDCKGSTAK